MEGDCHYLEGNLNARRRVEYIQGLLDEIGLENRRLKMINISSAMGSEFALSAEDFTNQITELGPNPLRRAIGKESKEKIK
jgi:coenzyme F420-reducing hydrogenase delta subunit